MEASDTATGYERLLEFSEMMKKASSEAARKIAANVLELGFALGSDWRWMDYEEIDDYAKGFSDNFLVRGRNSEQEDAHILLISWRVAITLNLSLPK